MVKAHVRAVPDRPRREEARKGVADGIENEGRAAHVEVALLLAGKTRVRQVLGRRGRADGDVRGVLTVLARQCGVGLHDVGLDGPRQRGLRDRRPDALRATREVVDVGWGEPRELILHERVGVRFAHERTKCVGRHREAVRHAHPKGYELPQHLAQGGVLSSHRRHIVEGHVA